MNLREWYDVTNLASLLMLCVFSGAVSYRVWRLLALDTILDGPRVWLLSQSPEWFVDFVRCPWCLGWWLNVAIAVGMYAFADISFTSAVVVAFVGSTITGVIGRGD